MAGGPPPAPPPPLPALAPAEPWPPLEEPALVPAPPVIEAGVDPAPVAPNEDGASGSELQAST
jgi:hypothetical protein